MCPNGFEGDRCEVDIDECAKMPCSNGGRCSDMIGDFKCLCPSGYSGRKCEVTFTRLLFIVDFKFEVKKFTGEYPARPVFGAELCTSRQASINSFEPYRVVRCSTSYEY